MPRLAAIALTLASAGTTVAGPITLEPLILDGQAYEGIDGTIRQTTFVSRINNSGQWVSVVTNDTQEGGVAGRHIVAYDGVRHRPGQLVQFNDDITLHLATGFYTAINNHGQVALSVVGLGRDADGNAVGPRSGIFLDGAPVVRSGDPRPVGGSYPNSLSSSQFVLDDSGRLLSNFQFNSTIFGGNDSLVEFVPNQSGGYDQILRVNPDLPVQDGYRIRFSNTMNWGSYDLNNGGDTVYSAVLMNDEFVTKSAIVLNGEIARISGESSLFDDGSLDVNPNYASVNASGDFAYTGNMYSSEWDGFRQVVMRNQDELVWIDDGTTPELVGHSVHVAAVVDITDGGDVLWRASLYDQLGLFYTGIFLNDELIASGDPTIEGVLTIEEGFLFDISDNGEWMIFDTSTGVYRARIPAPGPAALLAIGAAASLIRKRRP
jgi:hypothetical protein